MAYRCPLTPPHVDETGMPMTHKNRKECMTMGLHNRSKVTHPEKFPASSFVAASPPMGANEESGKVEPTTPEAPTPAPATPAAKPKKGKFSIFHKPSGDAPQGKDPEEKKEPVKWSSNLPEDATIMFWSTILSFVRGAVSWFDKTIKARDPYDTSQLEFTTAEERMVGETMTGPTTRLLQKLGIKSVDQAVAFIHGMAIIRIFGRIVLSLGAHFYKELKIRGKEKDKERKEANERRKTESKEPPEATPTPHSGLRLRENAAPTSEQIASIPKGAMSYYG